MGKITDYTERTAPNADDVAVISDASETSTHKVQLQNLNKSVLTTKGDLLVRDGSGDIVRLPVGSNDEILVGNSGDAEGVSYKTLATLLANILTSNGDILIRNSSGNITNLNVGNEGQVLVAGSSAPQWTGSLPDVAIDIDDGSSPQTLSVSLQANTTYAVTLSGRNTGSVVSFGLPSGASGFGQHVSYDTDDTIAATNDRTDLSSASFSFDESWAMMRGYVKTGGSSGTFSADSSSGNSFNAGTVLRAISVG